MNICLIAAIGNNYELGKDNKLLCRLPIDLQHFKNITWGSPIILGRKTFDSLGQQTLPGRTHIVITTTANAMPKPNVFYANCPQDALSIAEKIFVKKVFVIGGAKIYDLFLPLANELCLTRIKATIDADVFFPKVNFMDWRLCQNIVHHADDKHEYDFEFQTWQRKKTLS